MQSLGNSISGGSRRALPEIGGRKAQFVVERPCPHVQHDPCPPENRAPYPVTVWVYRDGYMLGECDGQAWEIVMEEKAESGGEQKYVATPEGTFAVVCEHMGSMILP
jgi:hypothetical protein